MNWRARACEADPRTKAQRRADALGALVAGPTEMCSLRVGAVRGRQRVTGRHLVIHVFAEQASIDGADTHRVICPARCVTAAMVPGWPRRRS